MSRKIPQLSGLQVIKLFCNKFNFTCEAGAKHAKLKGVIKGQLRIFPVPLHKELAKGTLLAIIRESGLKRDEFLDALNE